MIEAQGGQTPDAQMQAMARDNTLELNAAHPIIVNLNQLRKTNKVQASMVAQGLLDNVMIQSGIPYDMNQGIDRRYQMISQFLEMSTDSQDVQTTRKVEAEPVMKQAQKEMKGDGAKIEFNHTVSEKDFKQK